MNNRSQFFIFAAVLVIFSLLAIQYSLLSYRQISQSVGDASYSDIPYISSYIESSFRDTTKNAFEEIYRTGDISFIHKAFAGLYSAHYAIEERELNYYLSKLDLGIEVTKSSNITFGNDLLFLGPSIFEIGYFNRKLLIDARRVSDSPKKYIMISEIGEFEVAPSNKNSQPSPSNPYVIHRNNQKIFRDANYSSGSRIIHNNRTYTIGEDRISYGGLRNVENLAPFIENYSLNISNDYVNVLDIRGNQITIEGSTEFYEGDVFLLDRHLIKINEIKYIPNGLRDDYVRYTILNIQISLQETERRRQWFDPNETPGLRYGLVDVMAIRENGVRTTPISTGDTVVISSSIHNDLEGPIYDKDITGIKNLGSSIRIWEIVNVNLIQGKGIFESEGSRYEVRINTITKKIEGIYEISGTSEILIDMAYPLGEGFEFNLRGEQYVVRSISSNSVSFLRISTNTLDVRIDLSPDYGEFRLGGRTHVVSLVRDEDQNVDPYQATLETQMGPHINLKIGDPAVLDNYLLVLDSVSFVGTDEKWHVYLKYFDMAQEMKQFPVEKTRLFHGWKDGEYQVINTWKYSYSNGKIIIESESPSQDTNGALITPDGILACFSSINDQNFFEYNLYYPKEGQVIFLGDTLVLFEEINTSRNYVKIRIDENKSGNIDESDGYIHVNGSNQLTENDVFYSGGVGFKIVSIVPHYEDEIGRVLLKRVPYYQYVPILERSGRSNIEEFTTIISSYKFTVRRPGDYLIVFNYSFEIDGTKKETNQYYNFKVYQ